MQQELSDVTTANCMSETIFSPVFHHPKDTSGSILEKGTSFCYFDRLKGFTFMQMPFSIYIYAYLTLVVVFFDWGHALEVWQGCCLQTQVSKFQVMGIPILCAKLGCIDLTSPIHPLFGASWIHLSIMELVNIFQYQSVSKWDALSVLVLCKTCIVLADFLTL